MKPYLVLTPEPVTSAPSGRTPLIPNKEQYESNNLITERHATATSTSSQSSSPNFWSRLFGKKEPNKVKTGSSTHLRIADDFQYTENQL